MAKRSKNRYREMESLMTKIILGDALVFVLYLVCAGMGWAVFKVITGIIAIVVVFQPELRHALESMGKSRISNLTFLNFTTEKVDDETLMKNCIAKVVDGVTELSKHDVGALIVFERETKLGEIISTGTIVNADPSKEIIGNIFFRKLSVFSNGIFRMNGTRIISFILSMDWVILLLLIQMNMV